MAEKTPEHLHGVSLRHYATMTAGLADGIPREELLAHLQLDAVRWERAERLWNEHILDELEAGRSLSESLDALVAEARASFARPIPPLDAELRAWLDVQRAYALESDPLAFLARMGLRPSDMARLQSLWTARMKEEPSLQIEALRIQIGRAHV